MSSADLVAPVAKEAEREARAEISSWAPLSRTTWFALVHGSVQI